MPAAYNEWHDFLEVANAMLERNRENPVMTSVRSRVSG